ncbi:collagen alpha-1(III) chain [Cyclospora cayetanensis]|uniref:Collagen alpha-1(III) chain n=1 Tax=Cyclospora cayetanensis TaxID=88456 RepID=A0A6P6S4K4_9EIME|nr:collagen alpha-1(III) chain [Cyclospora cayetanensis]
MEGYSTTDAHQFVFEIGIQQARKQQDHGWSSHVAFGAAAQKAPTGRRASDSDRQTRAQSSTYYDNLSAMQPPPQAGGPPAFRGQPGQTSGPGGPAQRPMQQQPRGPGMAGPMNAPQRPGPPGVQQIGGPAMRPVGPGGPPGGPQGPRPGGINAQGSFRDFPRGPMGGFAGGPMGGQRGGPMGGPPGGPMGGPMGGPPGGPMSMRPSGPPGAGRPMQPQMGGPGGPGPQMRRPGGPMGAPPMQMMRGPSGHFEAPQRSMEGGGGTGGPPDMRGFMRAGPPPEFGIGDGHHGRPDMSHPPMGKMQQQPSPSKPVHPHAPKLVVHRPTRKTREGRLWCINDNWEVGRLTNSGFRSLGLLGNEYLVDLAFNPLDGSLWAVNRLGELLRWSGYSLDRKAQHGFHKLKAITFDRKGNLWALNTACELAVWNEQEEEWDVKDIPGALRLTDLTFDERNRLWIIGPEGQLMVLSGSKWVNFGFVGCWKMKDLSFKVPKSANAKPSSPVAEAS